MKRLIFFFLKGLNLVLWTVAILALVHMFLFCIPLTIALEAIGIYNYGLAIASTLVTFLVTGLLASGMDDILKTMEARLPIKPEPHPFIQKSLALAEENALSYLNDLKILIVIPSVFISITIELFSNFNVLWIEVGAGGWMQSLAFFLLIGLVYSILALCYDLLSGQVSRKLAKTSGFMVPAIKGTLADMRYNMRHEKEEYGRNSWFKREVLAPHTDKYMFLKRHVYNQFNVRLV